MATTDTTFSFRSAYMGCSQYETSLPSLSRVSSYGPTSDYELSITNEPSNRIALVDHVIGVGGDLTPETLRTFNDYVSASYDTDMAAILADPAKYGPTADVLAACLRPERKRGARYCAASASYEFFDES